MSYDVAIIGAGAVGAAAARVLSQYDIKTVLLEKCADVCQGVSKANSGIVHGAFHYPLSTLKGRLERQGNPMFDALQQELGFPFKRCGIIVAAFREEERTVLQELCQRGVDNGVPDIRIVSRQQVLELEPKLQDDVLCGLYVPWGGVIEPYRYVFGLVDAAKANGVEVITGFEAACAGYHNGAWQIVSAAGDKVSARYVINAAGLFADRVSAIFGAEEFHIRPRKGEEYLLKRECAAKPEHVIFPVPSKHSKGVLVIPTAGGTTMIGPTADSVDDPDDNTTTGANRSKIFSLARNMVKGVEEKDLIAAFSGSRPVLDTEEFMICISRCAPAFIQAAGIQSPGLTASPAIGGYLRDLLSQAGLGMKKKPTYTPPRRQLPQLRDLSPEEVDRLHAKDPAWTNIICRCEKVSEAEIVDAIRRGHTTIEGIKLHTRAGMGGCQGGFCSARIMKIIARETGRPLSEITIKGSSDKIVNGTVTEEAEK